MALRFVGILVASNIAMTMPGLKLTYVGGPTALLQIAGLRLLTDPTFDPAGQEFRSGAYILRKNAGPRVDHESLGHVDAVLLSHDHHFDNLDLAGRDFLTRAGRVLTTPAGAERLGGNASGLAPWESVELPAEASRTLRITATPAQHGPSDHDRGPVVGFILALTDSPDRVVYVSGDTVWYEGVNEVIRRFPIKVALLFMGAARVPAVGPWHLTFTATEAVEFARACPEATIVPLHFEDWEHFSESRDAISRTFIQAGLGHRLRWPDKDLGLAG